MAAVYHPRGCCTLVVGRSPYSCITLQYNFSVISCVW